MCHNEKIVFRNMADEKPNMETGNVNFIIQEKEHEVFKRKGADLLIAKSMSLKEALTGFAWKIKHLDGRQIVIQSKPGEVIQAEGAGGRPFVKKVSNEGMPSKGNPFVKGNLYVLFTVEFPQAGQLTDAQIAGLTKFLPGPDMDEGLEEEEDVEIAHLDEADVRLFGKGGAASQESVYDSDEDGANGQQPVNCQQS
jgi:DnaJ family protein A protein 2